MTKKPTLTNIASGFASNTQLNSNFQQLKDAFDNTLSLDGSTPNAMNADLDLNGNNINNVGDLGITGELTIDGQVVTSILTVPDWKGEWVTATAYVLNDLVRYNGSSYIVKVAHTSGTFSTDLATGKLEVFAEKGAAGIGDMITTNNLSDLTNKPQAIVNLGISATAAELNYVDGVTSNVQTQLDTKASLASPALTGSPTAPTATAGTNTTQVATTEFVLANGTKMKKVGAVSLNGLSLAEFTGIPADANTVILTLNVASMNTAGNFLVQLGTAGGYVASGSTSLSASGGTTAVLSNATNQLIWVDSAAHNAIGKMVFTKFETGGVEAWVQNSAFLMSGSNIQYGSGSTVLSAPLTKLKVYTSAGAFDNGAAYLWWEA